MGEQRKKIFIGSATAGHEENMVIFFVQVRLKLVFSLLKLRPFNFKL